MKAEEIRGRQDVPEDIKKHLLRYIKKYDQILEELRESDEWHRTIIQSAPYGILRVDKQGLIIESNKAYCQMSGYTQEELTKMSIVDVDLETMKTVSEYLQRIITNGKDNFETQHRRKDGNVFDVEVTAQCQSVEKSLFIFFLNDITKRKISERELVRAQSNEAVKTMAAGIAHDFNNVLQAINGFVEILIRGETDLKRKKNLEIVLEAGEKAGHLVGQIRLLSKSDVQKREVASIAKVIKENVELSLRGSDCKCELSLPKDLWLVNMDSGEIGRVIRNLIFNAKYHGVSEKKIIWVEAKNCEIISEKRLGLDIGKFVHIMVIDSGKGISKENLEKVFIPYFTTKESNEVCTGLGLANVNTIVTNHGGICTVESEECKGAKFNIYLPAIDEKEVEKEVNEKDSIFLRSLKILVMDDESQIRKIISRILLDLGHQVKLAEDETEALGEYILAHEIGRPFDLVILDMTIPGSLGGLETLRKIQEVNPNVIAVISSGYPIESIEGFADTLPKPYSEKQVAELIVRLFK